MIYWVYFFITIIIGLLEAGLLNYFRVFGAGPDLLLISAVTASLVFEFKWAFILCLFSGFLKDTFAASLFGMNALLFPLWSFLIARLNRQITLDYYLTRVGLVFIISLAHNIISGLVSIYLGNFIPLGIFLRIVSVASIYTALVSLIVFKFAHRPLSAGAM